MIRLFAAALLLTLGTGLYPHDADSKQYNKRQGMPPSAQAKVARIKAKTANQQQENGGDSGDVVNSGCGKLDIGRVDEVRPGQNIDRDIIITGDIINLGCKRR